MKKAVVVMVLLAAGTVFTSCSKDDDQDPIIGNWSFIESSRIEDGKTTKKELTDCQKKGGATFLVDGNYTATSYYLDNDECKLNDSTKGTWKNLGNSVYQFESDGETNKGEVIFSGDTFSTSSKDGEITHVSVYKKVK